MLSYSDLLSKIYDDENIELVLETLGCHNIHSEQGGKLIVATRPEGTNRRSIQIKNMETLRASIRSKGVYGNLYDVVMFLNKLENIRDAYNFLTQTCSYTSDMVYVENPLTWLNKIKRQRKTYAMDFEELEILDSNILNQYIYGDVQQFNLDGIKTQTLLDYGVGYDAISNRITIPIYDIHGNLIGVKGRATNKEDESTYKFMFLYPADQSKTLFNFHRAKAYCKQKKEVHVLESEKAPMQCKDCGIMNAVGVGSSGISLDQLNILLTLQCDINLAFDKGTDYDAILPTFENFFRDKRNVFVMRDDEYNILSNKSSPIDESKDVWDFLYENRIQLV